MDFTTPALKLCLDSTRAEFQGRREDARALCRQAWQAAGDDYDACVAAHYVARYEETPEARLYWNQLALTHADAVGDERVRDFYPSLYVNLGRAHELLGHAAEAEQYYQLAAKLGLVHHSD
jgi:hypothetical protein